MAEALGIAAEHMWEVLARQAVITGTVDLATDVVWVLGATVLVIFAWKSKWAWFSRATRDTGYTTKEGDIDGPGGKLILSILAGITFLRRS